MNSLGLIHDIRIIECKPPTTNFTYQYKLEVEFQIFRKDILLLPQHVFANLENAIKGTVLEQIDFKDIAVQNLQGLA